jgi:type IV secretion system protein VirD4
MVKVKSPPQHRVLFLLDEMAQLGTMQPLVKAISLMRGYHMTLWMILQDLGQLKSLYPDNLWQTFLSNSKVQQYFGVTDQETAEYVSKLAGETTIDVTSTTEGRNTGKSHKNIFDSTDSQGKNTGKTITEQIRPLLRPDEVRRLSADEQLIFIQGVAPIWANKLKYYQDEELKILSN